MDILGIAGAVVTIAAAVTVVVSLIRWIRKMGKKTDTLMDGMRCLLRSEMTRTYFHNQEEKTIRQYEYENFVDNYEAYKVLGGNSFVDRIRNEIDEWEVKP